MDLAEIYRKHYKKLMLIPILILPLFLLGLSHLKLGIDFSGGFSVSVSSSTPINTKTLEETLKRELNVVDITIIPLIDGYIIEFSYPPHIERIYRLFKQYKSGDGQAKAKLIEILDTNDIEVGVSRLLSSFTAKVESIIKRVDPNVKDITIREVSPIVGPDFWNAMMWIAFWAIVLTLLVVIIYFRHPIPIAIIIASTIFDGLAILSLMGITNIPLTLATLSIVLMMVAYSIDTDMVASTYVFKRRLEEGIYRGAERAFKTGITMSITTLASMIIVYIVGLLTANITVLRIANVMIYGLVADIIITWTFNTPLLIWVGERYAKKH